MTFDYFNSSKLAFGQKLTKAFSTLEKLLDKADLHVDTVLRDLQFYGKYINRNYEAPTPHRPDMPARVDEVLSVVKNVSKIDMSYTNNKFSVRMAVIVNGKPTVCYGETTNKSGYAFAKPTTSYTNLTGSIRFGTSSTVERVDEVYLFRYRINKHGHIIIINSVNSFLPAGPYDESRYTSISLKDLPLTNGSYTASEPTAVLVTCNIVDNNDVNIYLRGHLVFCQHRGYTAQQPLIFYLDKGDTVSGSISSLKEIVYNIKTE